MDALVVDEGSVWDPKDEVKQNINKMLKEVKRVMKPNESAFL